MRFKLHVIRHHRKNIRNKRSIRPIRSHRYVNKHKSIKAITLIYDPGRLYTATYAYGHIIIIGYYVCLRGAHYMGLVEIHIIRSLYSDGALTHNT